MISNSQIYLCTKVICRRGPQTAFDFPYGGSRFRTPLRIEFSGRFETMVLQTMGAGHKLGIFIFSITTLALIVKYFCCKYASCAFNIFHLCRLKKQLWDGDRNLRVYF